MPHMAPIMWALIMFMTFTMMMIMLMMVYFMNSPFTPELEKSPKKLFYSNWLW